VFPDFLQSVKLIQTDPTNSSVIYAIAPACLSTSNDHGESWSPCLKATGLEGSFVDLLIKDSATMVMLRNGDVRCAFFDMVLLSRMLLDHMHVHLKQTCV
jgi:hypothetical protein